MRPLFDGPQYKECERNMLLIAFHDIVRHDGRDAETLQRLQAMFDYVRPLTCRYKRVSGSHGQPAFLMQLESNAFERRAWSSLVLHWARHQSRIVHMACRGVGALSVFAATCFLLSSHSSTVVWLAGQAHTYQETSSILVDMSGHSRHLK